jgi:Co/Zn/Cd efflux system component
MPRPEEEKLTKDLLGSDYGKGDGMTNERVLWLTMWMFALFVAAEILGAILSNSLALLSDAAAMGIDVITYLCNIYVERVKNREGSVDRNTRMWTEVYVPAFSMAALVGVSAWITSDAIKVIIDPPSEDEDDVDVLFLYVFAGANMLVDIISALMFWVKRSTIFTEGGRIDRTLSVAGSVVLSQEEAERLPLRRLSVEDRLENERGETNVNMLTAWIHISGDTLRTLSEFVAAAIATAGASAALCDAWACVVATITICGMVVYAGKEIYNSYGRIQVDFA